MKPLVVIVGRQSDDAQGVRGKPFAAGQTYFRSVERAGGIPLMLPPIVNLIDDIPSLLQRVDGVVFHGGGDVDPRRYGQRANEESLYGIVEEHDAAAAVSKWDNCSGAPKGNHCKVSTDGNSATYYMIDTKEKIRWASVDFFRLEGGRMVSVSIHASTTGRLPADIEALLTQAAQNPAFSFLP